MKSKVHLKTKPFGEYGAAHLLVSINGSDYQILGTMGGGEPEDNTWSRDWDWIPGAFIRVLTQLGIDGYHLEED